MSNLSEFFPAGAGKQVSFVASGTVGDGVTVILNSDGTVSAVSGQSYSAESEVSASGSDTSTSESAAVFDSTNNKVVVCFRRSNNSYAVVGTISGSTISFGTAVEFLTNRNMSRPVMAFDSNEGAVIIAYRDDGSGANNYGQAIAGKVSGTSISFGTASTFYSNSIAEVAIAFDDDTNVFSVFFPEITTGKGAYYTGTVSSALFIAWRVYNYFDASTNNARGISACFDSNANAFVLSYGGATSKKAIAGTLSTYTISFGTAVDFSSSTVYVTNYTPRPVVFDSVNNKVVFLYNAYDAGGTYLTDYALAAAVGTVSGNSISFGDEAKAPEVSGGFATTSNMFATFDPDTAEVVLVLQVNDNSSQIITFKVSGTSGSFISQFNGFNGTSTAASRCVVYDTNANKCVATFVDYGDSSKTNAMVFDAPSTNATSENFIGISDGAISNGASGRVTIKGGVSSKVSSLTANSVYYVANSGSITTTLSAAVTTNTVLAGRAMSSTSIDLDYST